MIVVTGVRPLMDTVWRPGGSGLTSAIQPCATDTPGVPSGSPKTLSAPSTTGSVDVSTSLNFCRCS